MTSPSCDHIVLAFEAELAGFTHLRFGLQRQEILDAHHLGADEAALDVRVDLSGRLVGREALADRPGAAFVVTRGEEADERQQRECRAHKPIARRFGEAESRDEVLLIGGRHLGDVLFDLGRQDDQTETALRRMIGNRRRRRFRHAGLVHVQDDEQRLLRQEPVAGEERLVLLRERQVANRIPGLEMGVQLRQEIRLARIALLLLEALEPLLDQLEVREDHLGFEVEPPHAAARRESRRTHRHGPAPPGTAIPSRAWP